MSQNRQRRIHCSVISGMCKHYFKTCKPSFVTNAGYITIHSHPTQTILVIVIMTTVIAAIFTLAKLLNSIMD